MKNFHMHPIKLILLKPDSRRQLSICVYGVYEVTNVAIFVQLGAA